MATRDTQENSQQQMAPNINGIYAEKPASELSLLLMLCLEHLPINSSPPLSCLQECE